MKVFRDFLMTPGDMLCLSGREFDDYTKCIETLSEKGYIVAERFRGGFSLTALGYSVMTGG